MKKVLLLLPLVAALLVGCNSKKDEPPVINSNTPTTSSDPQDTEESDPVALISIEIVQPMSVIITEKCVNCNDFEIDFGDGTIKTRSQILNEYSDYKSQRKFTHKYDKEGTYTITIVAYSKSRTKMDKDSKTFSITKPKYAYFTGVKYISLSENGYYFKTEVYSEEYDYLFDELMYLPSVYCSTKWEFIQSQTNMQNINVNASLYEDFMAKFSMDNPPFDVKVILLYSSAGPDLVALSENHSTLEEWTIEPSEIIEMYPTEIRLKEKANHGTNLYNEILLKIDYE